MEAGITQRDASENALPCLSPPPPPRVKNGARHAMTAQRRDVTPTGDEAYPLRKSLN